MRRSNSTVWAAARVAAGVMIVCGVALGQAAEKIEPIKPPDMADFVLRNLEATYLTDAERAQLRTFHGVWTESDLTDPALRAEAALTVGAFDDPVFDDPAVSPVDRAEALAARGDLEAALTVVKPGDGARAGRIRVQSLIGLGRLDEAVKEADALVDRLGAAGNLRDPERATELVRVLMMRSNLRGESGEHYSEMIRMLTTVHQELDRSYWPAILAEAELLVQKNAAKEGQEAALDVLRRNPMCARAWHLLGWWAVQTMSYEKALPIAERLDRLDRRMDPGSERTSAFGDLVRARAAIRQNDPDTARRALDPTLDRYPTMREVVAVECAIDALSFDPEVLERSLAAFDELSPGSPEALYEAGAALAERRQYEEGADLLNRAIERQPDWPEPWITLGLLEMQAGRDAEAKAALERATALDPFNVRAKNSLVLVNDVDRFDAVETEHFVIRHKPGIDDVMAREMPALVEEMHHDVTSAMEFEPAGKTIIELMPDHESFSVRITGNSDVYTMAASTGPLLAMEAPKIGRGHMGIYDWQRVVRHEYTHTVTLAKTKNRIPIWFTEAAAVEMEHGPRDYNRCRLIANAVRNNTLFPLDHLSIAFARVAERPQAYAQAHMMYEYILSRWGAEAPLKMMDGYAAGDREPQIMREVLGVSGAEFMAAFKEWAWDEVKSWGMAAEPSVDGLRITETLADEELGAGLERSLQEFALSSGVRAASGGFPATFDPELAPVTPSLVEYWFSMYPDHPDIVEMALSLRLAESDGEATDQTAPLIEKYASLRPVDPMPHRLLARLYLKSGQNDRAIPHLEFLDQREVWTDTYAIELAKLYADAGRWDQATSKAERATHISPFDPGNREIAARVAIGARDFDTAERHLRALIELEPNQKRHLQRLEALQKMRQG